MLNDGYALVQDRYVLRQLVVHGGVATLRPNVYLVKRESHAIECSLADFSPSERKQPHNRAHVLNYNPQGGPADVLKEMIVAILNPRA